MNLPVILRPEAEQDLVSAQAWYEQQRSDLGTEFLARVSEALDQIAARPETHGIVWLDVRFCRLRRFPYVIYYRVLAERIEVLAVLHGSRDPTVWQSRA